jgi:hypothetical protein
MHAKMVVVLVRESLMAVMRNPSDIASPDAIITHVIVRTFRYSSILRKPKPQMHTYGGSACKRIIGGGDEESF